MVFMPLRQMNQALLGKWLWRFGKEPKGPWRQLLAKKYGLLRYKWDVQDTSYKAMAIWKCVVSIKKIFIENIRYHVRLGGRILFWYDLWVGDRPLAI